MPDLTPSHTTTAPAVDRARFAAAARTVMQRCDELASFSETTDGLKRTFCSAAMAHVHARLQSWMSEAGMRCRLDPVTNLIGRYDGSHGEQSPTLILGSHLDSVANAGKYDGVLGVLVGLAVVELLHAERVELPVAIDVIGFCEEEGIRFETPFLGSLAVAGRFDESLLERIDEYGVTMREAIAQFGGDPNNLPAAAYDPAGVLGYIEPHIEQGPTLDRDNLPVGIVSAIAGQTRAAVTFLGQAGHAGTVPISQRRDALAAAAEWITAVETIATGDDELFATVGCLDVEPNVANVIPEVARLRLDVRHARDDRRRAVHQEILSRGEAIAHRRRLTFAVDWLAEQSAVTADGRLSHELAESIKDCGVPLRDLPSGAGHDAAVMATRFPSAMLFLRCRDGISHHPNESVREEDVAVAIEVLWRTVQRLSKDG